MRRKHTLAFALVAFAAGCGGASTADVSGVVTLDEKPLAGATVTFNPVSTKDRGVGGSYGKTDSDGRYRLRTVVGDKAGAAVGKHKVTISLSKENKDNPEAAVVDLVPAMYNVNSDLTFDVPAGGTSQADFKLTR